jgi:hypothetical protein
MQYSSLHNRRTYHGMAIKMEFLNKISNLTNKSKQIGASLLTEEATKNALVMPFLSTVLGYDVFDPSEVVPEFTADIGTKKGEKVDYALFKDGKVQILVECKKYAETLSVNHASQLFRYFAVTQARIAILTNGHQYLFFTDLDAPNKMDEKPFLELDLENVDEHALPAVSKLTKQDFDLDSIISTAGELRYVQQIKRILGAQYKEPEDDFVRFFASRVYDGVLTQKVRDQFAGVVAKSLAQHLNDKVNERLKSALDTTERPGAPVANQSNEPSVVDVHSEDSDEIELVTTEEELEGFYIVLSTVRKVIDAKRVVQRPTQSYFGILADDNNRKPICRLHFNRTQKYLGIFDSNKKETRHPIETVDDIFQYTDALLETAKAYAD